MKRFLAVGMVLVAAIITWVLLVGRRDSARSEAAVPGPGNRCDAFRVILASDQELSVLAREGSGGIAAAVGTRLELVVETDTGASDDRSVTIVEVTDAPVHEIRFGGVDLAADDAAARDLLVGRRAMVRYGNDGAVVEIRVPQGTPEVTERILHTIVAAMDLRAPDRPVAVGVLERTSLGQAELRYERARAEDGFTIRRTLEDYDDMEIEKLVPEFTKEVRGSALASFSNDGGLRKLSGSEEVAATSNGHKVLNSRSKFDVELLGRGSSCGDVGNRLAARRSLFVFDEKADDRQVVLEQRAGGMTRDRLVSDIWGLKAGDFANHSRWLWNATGLLHLHPGYCRDLGNLFLDPGIYPRARRLILDLLASTGHAEAQAELRRVLESDVVKTSNERELYYQRLGLVARPDRETVTYAARHFREAPEGARQAEAYTLGAVAGAAYRGGLANEASAAMGPLVEELRSAKTIEEKVDALTAIGNGGLPESVEVVAPYASAKEPEVRRAAAKALRKDRSAAGRELLFSLASDRDPAVQGIAVDTLAQRSLGAEEMARLRRLIVEDRLDLSVADRMVSLLTPYSMQHDTIAILEELRKRVKPSDRVIGRIDGLLRQAKAGSSQSSP